MGQCLGTEGDQATHDLRGNMMRERTSKGGQDVLDVYEKVKYPPAAKERQQLATEIYEHNVNLHFLAPWLLI